MELFSSILGALINGIAGVFLSFGLFAHPVASVSTVPTDVPRSDVTHAPASADSQAPDLSSWNSYSLPGIEFKAPSSTIENPRITQGKGYGIFQVIYADQFGITIEAQAQPEKIGIIDFKDYMNFPADYSTTTNYEGLLQQAPANNQTLSSTTVDGIEAAQRTYDCTKTPALKTAQILESETAKDRVIYSIAVTGICNHPEGIDLYRKLISTVKFTKI